MEYEDCPRCVKSDDSTQSTSDLWLIFLKCIFFVSCRQVRFFRMMGVMQNEGKIGFCNKKAAPDGDGKRTLFSSDASPA